MTRIRPVITPFLRDGEGILCYKSTMTRNGRRPTGSSAADSERRAAEQDEQARFNAACARRGPAPLQTPAGLQLVWQVTPDWWYVCGPDAHTAASVPGRHDDAWATLLAWVGEDCHPLWATHLQNPNGRRRQ